MRVVFSFDADGLEAGAGDPERRRIVAAQRALVIDQALVLRLPRTFGVRRSGSTDTITSADLSLRKHPALKL